MTKSIKAEINSVSCRW